MDKIKYIYTWKDIDRIFKNFNKKQEYPYFNEVDVYHDEIVVNLNDMSKKDEAKKVLAHILKNHYDNDSDTVKFDLFDKKMKISWEEDEKIQNNIDVIPLFKDVIYHDKSYGKDILNNTGLDECPVIAFHSYKGGVGRTLSLLAFAKAWSTNSEKKLLIIDSDIEAPGLTWLMQEEGDFQSQISYFDILEMIQASELKNDDIYNPVFDSFRK